MTGFLARIMLHARSEPPRQRAAGWRSAPLNKFRIFGECTMAVAMVALTLAVGFGAMMAVSTQALQFASLN